MMSYGHRRTVTAAVRAVVCSVLLHAASSYTEQSSVVYHLLFKESS
jgi:hypothetical protein